MYKFLSNRYILDLKVDIWMRTACWKPHYYWRCVCGRETSCTEQRRRSKALSQNLPQNRVVKTRDLYYTIEIEETKPLPDRNKNWFAIWQMKMQFLLLIFKKGTSNRLFKNWSIVHPICTTQSFPSKPHHNHFFYFPSRKPGFEH